jgi:hypothetical protein
MKMSWVLGSVMVWTATLSFWLPVMDSTPCGLNWTPDGTVRSSRASTRGLEIRRRGRAAEAGRVSHDREHFCSMRDLL